MSAWQGTAVARVARDLAVHHPRHLILGALVAGLLTGPRWPLLGLVLGLLAARLAGSAAVAAGAVAALLGAGALAEIRLGALDRTALGPVLGRSVAVRATLLEHPRRLAFGTRVAAVRLRSEPGRGERVVLRVPGRLRWPSGARPGAEVVTAGRLEALSDRDAHERRRHAHAVLHVARLRATGKRRGGMLGALDAVRSRTERALTTGVPAREGALARGMVLGQDDALTPDVRDDFRASGLAHLVAASGANVALLAALAMALATAAGVGLTARLALAIALVAAYVPLAGGGPSIQRAGVMGAAALVAAMAGRPASRWYALLLAAAVTLSLDPRAAEDPGWQLSFAAVVSLLALFPAIDTRLRRRLPRGLAAAVAVTAAATVGTAPLIALHFGRVSLVSLPANVLAVPAVAPVMWLGTVAGAAGQIAPGLAAPVAAMSVLPLGYLEGLADRAASIPYSEMETTTIAGLLRRSPAGAAGPGLRVSFFDVGQGDATLLQHGRAAILVDTGPPDGPIAQRLREARVGDIDVLVLTHGAQDHDGGLARVLAEHRVGLLLDGVEAASPAAPGVLRAAVAHKVRRLASDAGQIIRAGALELRVLWPRRHPGAKAEAEPNDRATVLHVRDGAFDLLLTADAESGVTGALHLPRVEVLKVAHHGSEDPGLPFLLKRLRPSVAVISAGMRNSYGHPAPSTLAALRFVGVLRRTDRDGTVRLRLHAGRIAVDP